MKPDKFDELSDVLTADLIIYGNAFVQYISDNGEFTCRWLDPEDVMIKGKKLELWEKKK